MRPTRLGAAEEGGTPGLEGEWESLPGGMAAELASENRQELAGLRVGKGPSRPAREIPKNESLMKEVTENVHQLRRLGFNLKLTWWAGVHDKVSWVLSMW